MSVERTYFMIFEIFDFRFFYFLSQFSRNSWRKLNYVFCQKPTVNQTEILSLTFFSSFCQKNKTETHTKTKTKKCPLSFFCLFFRCCCFVFSFRTSIDENLMLQFIIKIVPFKSLADNFKTGQHFLKKNISLKIYKQTISNKMSSHQITFSSVQLVN